MINSSPRFLALSQDNSIFIDNVFIVTLSITTNAPIDLR